MIEMYSRLFYQIKLTENSKEELLSRSSSSFCSFFLVVVERFYQPQPSNFLHIFVTKTEPESSYKIAHK